MLRIYAIIFPPHHRVNHLKMIPWLIQMFHTHRMKTQTWNKHLENIHRIILEVKGWYGLENFPPRLNHVKPKNIPCNQHSLAMIAMPMVPMLPMAWSQVKKSHALISSAFWRSDKNPSPRGKAPFWVTSNATKKLSKSKIALVYKHVVYDSICTFESCWCSSSR